MFERDHQHVAVLAYNHLCTFEFGIAVEIFGLPRPELKLQRPWYSFQAVALESRVVQATGGITIRASAGLQALQQAGTIVIPGWRNIEEAPPPRLLQLLRKAYQEGARILSICSGAFVLAAAGLLDGRQATTHWLYSGQLAQRYPKVQVTPDILFIDQGQILTSAGSAAGIDLCLYVVAQDYGAEIGQKQPRGLLQSWIGSKNTSPSRCQLHAWQIRQ
jgi:AraC family transcriptional regulator, transcriptional activator FtrA